MKGLNRKEVSRLAERRKKSHASARICESVYHSMRSTYQKQIPPQFIWADSLDTSGSRAQYENCRHESGEHQGVGEHPMAQQRLICYAESEPRYIDVRKNGNCRAEYSSIRRHFK